MINEEAHRRARLLAKQIVIRSLLEYQVIKDLSWAIEVNFVNQKSWSQLKMVPQVLRKWLGKMIKYEKEIQDRKEIFLKKDIFDYINVYCN